MLTIMIYNIFADTKMLTIFHSVTTISEIEKLKELFHEYYRHTIEYIIQCKPVETELENEIYASCYRFNLKTRNDDFWSFKLSCPINKTDKLLQLFKDERIKLEIQKEIFKVI